MMNALTVVIPTKAGISGQRVTAGPTETPAFAGATRTAVVTR